MMIRKVMRNNLEITIAGEICLRAIKGIPNINVIRENKFLKKGGTMF